MRRLLWLLALTGAACDRGDARSSGPPAGPSAPASSTGPAPPTTPEPLGRASALDRAITAGTSHAFTLRLAEGESAEIVVRQQGVDLIVELSGPDGTLLEAVDSPNGREGDEPLDVVARRSGEYAVRVRPIDEREPPGAYHLEVKAWRDRASTAELWRARAEERDAAARWLRPMSTALPAEGDSAHAPSPPLDALARVQSLPPFDTLARRVRVLGLGEATHGSREMADLRFALTRRLVERHGYRVVAIEASSARLASLEPYVAGRVPPGPAIDRAFSSGIWIGRRALRELADWARSWNAAHAADPLRLVGVDPQDSAPLREELARFLTRAYGPALSEVWAPVDRDLAEADAQTFVFGDSGVNQATRQALFERVAALELDAALLERRFGRAEVDSAQRAARLLARFADFNAPGGGAARHGRDWYMATSLLEALAAGPPPGPKAVFWGHNAHVSAPPGRPEAARPAGALLRDALGCDYGAFGITFGEGAFLAQVPNDPQDRLQASSLPPSPEISIDAMLATIFGPRRGALAAWPCAPEHADAPPWLARAQPMHWVGGLYDPKSLPSASLRSYNLLKDLDGIAFLPEVSAEIAPSDRPLVPARARRPSAP